MPAPLSEDLRWRIVTARNNGESKDEVAERFDVGSATVSRICRLYRLTGDVKAGKSTGRPPTLDDDDLAVLRELVVEQPDLLIPEYVDELATRIGKRTSPAAMSRSLAKLGFTRKKSRFTPRRETPKGSGS